MTTPNQKRASRASAALHQYVLSKSEVFDGSEEEVTDLIADLLHYCTTQGFNTSKVIQMSQLHHEAELCDLVENEERKEPHA